MDLKRLIFIYFSLLSLIGSAQYQFTPYELPNKIPHRYIMDEDSLRKVMMNRLPEQYKTSIYQDGIKKYVKMQANMVSQFLQSGDIYLDWPEIEGYVNEIIQKTLPPELIEEHHFRAYVTRDPSINAFVMNDGAIFVNIGLLAQIESEAMLAFVIGHEVSHHLNHDVMDRFVKEKENEDKYVSDRSLLGAIVGSVIAQGRTNSFSRDQESAADQLGLKLIKDTKFDLNQGVEVMQLFAEMGERYDLRRGSWFNGFLVGSTHPEPESRYRDLKRKIRKQEGTSSFLVSEEKFREVKQTAIYESLEALLRVHQHYECFETSFRLWLNEQENGIYRYYLMESLRRMMYTNPYQANQPIFLNEYQGRYRQKRKETNYEYQKRIAAQVKNIVSKALGVSKREAEEIPLPLWKNDTTSLISYEQLFHEIAWDDQINSYAECQLSKGLKKYTDGKEYKKYLRSYVADPTAKNKRVAFALLDSLTKEIPVKELVMLTSYKDPLESDSLYKLYQRYLENTIENEYATAIYIGINDSDEVFNFRETYELGKLIEFMNSIGNSNSRFNAWVYEPSYLEFYNELGLDKLHFLQVHVVYQGYETINQITLKTIDLNQSKSQVTTIQKRREDTEESSIKSMLKEALELNTRFFED